MFFHLILFSPLNFLRHYNAGNQSMTAREYADNGTPSAEDPGAPSSIPGKAYN